MVYKIVHQESSIPIMRPLPLHHLHQQPSQQWAHQLPSMVVVSSIRQISNVALVPQARPPQVVVS
jgi:hypothetical protein